MIVTATSDKIHTENHGFGHYFRFDSIVNTLSYDAAAFRAVKPFCNSRQAAEWIYAGIELEIEWEIEWEIRFDVEGGINNIGSVEQKSSQRQIR